MSNFYNPEDKYNKYNRPYSNHPHDIEPWGKDKKDTWQKPVLPKPVTIADLFPRLDRWGIGILNELEHFKTIADSKPSYPPYNITYDKAIGGVWEIAIAVAGFRKHELEVLVDDRTLIVRTNPDVNFEVEDVRQVIHQGIAQRNFELQFALAEYVVVKSVSLKDGLLHVRLEQELPEEKKPKIIDIE